MLALASGFRAWGQAPQRSVAFLSPFPRADVDAFVDQLRPQLGKLGWEDGRNVILLPPRTTEGVNERLAGLAAAVVADRPDVILVQSAPGTQAVMKATKTIPIVMVAVGNPVELGLVAGYRNPGSNVTGSTYLADESVRKLLQLLKDAAPHLRSVALFVNPTNEASIPLVNAIPAATAAVGMRAHVIEVRGPADFDDAFAAIRKERTESMLLIPEALIRSRREDIGAFAQRHGLPLAVVGGRRYLPAGGLLAYAPTTEQYAQLAARQIDQILKGAAPGDLPIEQPTRFELVVSLKTAKSLGLSLPPALLAGAELLP